MNINKLECFSCNSKNIYSIGKIPDTNYFAGNFFSESFSGGSLYHCLDCDFQFKFPQLTQEVFAELYSKSSGNSWKCSPEKRNDWSVAFRWIEKKINNNSKTNDNFKLLDVGCSSGLFLDYFFDKSIKKFGLEPSIEAANFSSEKNIKILGKFINDLDKDKFKSYFDVITAFDVLEHVEHPLKLINDMFFYIKPGGSLILSTLDHSVLSAKLMKNEHYYYVISEHISFMSKKWILKNFDKKLVDFVKVNHYGNSDKIKLFNEVFINLLYKYRKNLYYYLRILKNKNNNTYIKMKKYETPPNFYSYKDHMVFNLTK